MPKIGTPALEVFTTIKCGELTGVTTATQMPDIPCRLVKFKAHNDNPTNVYVGKSGVTVEDSATDTTTGFQLDAGDDTGWLLTDNLNRFYRICDATGDDLTYIALT